MLKILTWSEDWDTGAAGNGNLNTNNYFHHKSLNICDLIALVPCDLLAVSPGDRLAAVGSPHGALEAIGGSPRGARLGLVVNQLLLVSAFDLGHG